MRKLLMALLLLLAIPAGARDIFDESILDGRGRLAQNVRAYVYVIGETAVATVYDINGNALTQPLEQESNGDILFTADPGQYRVVCFGRGFPTRTYYWQADGSGGGVSDIVDDTTPQLGGDLDVNGNAIVSVSDGDIEITPNGTGSVVLDGLDWPQTDGTDGQVLTTNAAGTLSWGDPAVGGEGGILNVVEDVTPQLGGMLDVNAQAVGDGTRELLTFVEDGAAVNNVEIENASTGTSPVVRAVGDDADVPLVLEAKGAGTVVSNGSLTVIGDIRVTGTVDGVDMCLPGTMRRLRLRARQTTSP